jgi:hypothetical protein
MADNLIDQSEEIRSNKNSGLLRKLGIGAACLGPMIVYASLRGFCDS